MSAPSFQDEIFSAVRALITAFCETHGMESALGLQFFRDLEKECISRENWMELLEDVQNISQRLWSSALTLNDRCRLPYGISPQGCCFSLDLIFFS